MLNILSQMMNLIFSMVAAMLAMAFYTLSERKFLGYMQYRKGPNKPTLIAMTIPMADAMKLFSKESKKSISSNSKYLVMAPMTMMILALMLWPIYSHYSSMFFMKLGLLYFMSITSMSIYTTFMAGWSSNSKWGLLGALRGIAQTISYEVSMSMILIAMILHPSSMNLFMIMEMEHLWLLFLLMPLILMWLISILAETHRTPFDFAEGESELVSGFNIEYSSSPFALIFMAEYMNILFMSLITVLLTTSNFSSIELIFKSTLLSFMFIWTRGALPRLRYDILMDALWKKFLPASMLLLLFIMLLTAMMK